MPGPTTCSLAITAALAISLLPVCGLAAGQDSAPDADAERRKYYEKVIDLPADNVRGALEDQFRPPADRTRDASEKIEEVLRASGIARQMKVADLRARDGYFAQVLAPAVKWYGKVWANNDPASLDAETATAWKKRLDDPSAADIARVDNPLTAPVPSHAEPLDIVFSRGAYHDAVARGVDRAAMNAAVFAALKPGAKYVVTDARAPRDADPASAAVLCRVPEKLVQKEVQAAGFRPVSASKALDHKAESAKASACDVPAGTQVDRFLLVFEKPRPGPQ